LCCKVLVWRGYGNISLCLMKFLTQKPRFRDGQAGCGHLLGGINRGPRGGGGGGGGGGGACLQGLGYRPWIGLCNGRFRSERPRATEQSLR